MTENVGTFAGMGVLLCFSFLFSASETAIFSVSRTKRHRVEKEGGMLSRLLGSLLRDPDGTLLSILFGNLLVNVFFYALGAATAARAMAHGNTRWSVAVGVGTPLVVILFGEIIPKVVAVSRGEGFARFLALPVSVMRAVVLPTVGRAAGPLIAWIDRITASRASAYVSPEELRLLLDLTERAGAIGKDDGEILEDIMDLSELKVREIMAPRVEVVQFDISVPAEDVLSAAAKWTYSRFPVYEGDIDNTLGYVDVRDIFYSADRSGDLRRFVRPVRFVPETATVESLLEQLSQETGRGGAGMAAAGRGRAAPNGDSDFAVVVDEYGGMSGVVTGEDVVESVFGEIEDELEQGSEAPVKRLDSGEYRLSGRLLVRDWNEMFGLQTAGENFDTVGGLVVYLLGRLPHEGDSVRYRNLRFTVDSVRRRRVVSVTVKLEEEGAGPEWKEDGGVS